MMLPFDFPDDWKFVPITKGSKRPIGFFEGWQKNPFPLNKVLDIYEQGYIDYVGKDYNTKQPEEKRAGVGAIGVLCGPVSNGLMLLDHNGESCDRLLSEWGELPKTAKFSSGRKGHYQLAFIVPEVFWEGITTRKYRTGVIDTEGKHEQIELRWAGCQSLVLGTHPETGNQYQWDLSCTEIAEAPLWLIEKMLTPEHAEPQEPKQAPPDYDKVLDVIDQMEAAEPDDSKLHWMVSNYAYDEGLKQRGFSADYLLRQARARRDREGTLEIMDTQDILEMHPKRQWIVGGLLPANSVAIIAAPSGIGKTVPLYNVSKAIALGQDWCEMPTAKGKVLIVQVDEPLADTADKLREEDFYDVPIGAISWIRRWRFTQTRQLFEIINKLQPSLVIIDSITAAHAGTDTDMISSRAGDCVYKLRDFAEQADWPLSFWLVHHVNKGAVNDARLLYEQSNNLPSGTMEGISGAISGSTFFLGGEK